MTPQKSGRGERPDRGAGGEPYRTGDGRAPSRQRRDSELSKTVPTGWEPYQHTSTSIPVASPEWGQDGPGHGGQRGDSGAARGEKIGGENTRFREGGRPPTAGACSGVGKACVPASRGVTNDSGPKKWCVSPLLSPLLALLSCFKPIGSDP